MSINSSLKTEADSPIKSHPARGADIADFVETLRAEYEALASQSMIYAQMTPCGNADTMEENFRALNLIFEAQEQILATICKLKPNSPRDASAIMKMWFMLMTESKDSGGASPENMIAVPVLRYLESLS